MDILQMLFDRQDKEYASFQSKLVPGTAPERFIGVRVPEVRKLAKALVKQAGYSDFLRQLPHEYYDEDMLHGLLIAEIKDYETCISEIELFLPYVGNWAVCDVMSPKVFKRNKDRLIEKIRAWSASGHTYTCRFGLEMLMSHFLDDDFRPEYLEIPASVRLDEYYVSMMIAWFFATALAKQWDDALPYLENGRLEIWTHNKTIQKARESFRITQEQKERLKLLKR